MRTVLAAAAASAVALVPAVMVASPAQAVATTADSLTLSAVSNYEGGNLIFRFTYTGTAAAIFNLTPGGTATGAATLTHSGTTDYDSDDIADVTPVTFEASSVASPRTASVVVHTDVDATADDGQTVILTATADDDGSTKAATAYIYDTPGGTLPTLSLSGPASVAESAGSATVVGSLSSVLTHDVTIAVATSSPAAGDGTDAISTGGVNRDYTAAAADTSITIPAGSLTSSVAIAINDDTLDEVDTQYFRVTPSGPSAAISAFIPTTVDIGIVDNDATPSVSIANAPAATEGGTASFPIKLSGLSERALTVKFSTTDGSDNSTSRGATSGDYTSASLATVSIPALTQTVYQTVAVASDSVLEGTENFGATLSAPSPTGALTLGTPVTASGTITDGNSPAKPTVVVTTANSRTYTEGSTSVEKLIPVTVDLSSAASRETALTLAYKFTDITATNGVDYKGTDGTLTIPTSAGTSWTADIPVTVIGDTAYEPTETFKIDLTSPNSTLTIPTGGGTPATPITVTITDDDTQPTWSVGNASVDEGNTGTATAKVPVTLTAPAGTDTPFTYTLADGTATEAGVSTGTTVGANDYDQPAVRTLTIPAGSTTGWIEVPINSDTVYEQNETITVTPSLAGGNISNSTVTGTLHVAALTINNDDAKPSITFNNLTGTEGSFLRVNGTIVGVSQYPYSVGLKVATGSPDGATPGTDFDAPANLATTTVNVARGTSGALDVVSNPPFPSDFYLTPDTIDEPTESFTVTATENTLSLTGFTTSVGTYKITDDPADVPPVASIEDKTVEEDAGSADLEVKLTQVGDTTATTQAIKIPYWTVDGKAKAGSDYSETKGTLTIEPGMMTGTIKVPINNDKMKEGAENFYVKLGTPTSPMGATIAKGTGEVIIKANDGGMDDGDDGDNPTEPEQPGAPSIWAPEKIMGAQVITIKGEAASGSTVELWGAPFGDDDLKWIANGKADDDGKYEFERWIGQGYRFATQSNDLNSEETKTWVQQVPLFAASSPKKGWVSLAVQGNPRASGQTVIVQRWVGGKWVNAWRGMTGANNKWMATAKVASGSTHTLRAFVAGYTPDGLLPGYTANKKLTVK